MVLKKIFAFSFLSSLLYSVCYAAPLYGPDMPKRGQWYTGFEANIVFERAMRKVLGEAETKQYFYNASYGVYDWMSFDGKLGIGDTEFDTRDAGRLDYDFGFSGAYGFRFKIYNDEPKRVRAILGLQHISAHPPKEEVNNIKYTAIWDEWQLSLLLAKGFDRFEPYVGIKASQLYIIRKDNLENSWAWNGARDHFGIIVGSKADLFKNWYLDLEGRFIDETAFSLAISYKI